jgi:hypothetical protein
MSTLDQTSPDWFARLKAARGIIDVIGATPSRTQTARGAPQVLINIDVPDWAQGMLQGRGTGREVCIVTPADEADPA